MSTDLSIVLAIISIHLDTQQPLGGIAALHICEHALATVGADAALMLKLAVLSDEGGVPGQAGSLQAGAAGDAARKPGPPQTLQVMLQNHRVEGGD